MTSRVFITGGQGLVGKALAIRVLAQGLKARVSTRRKLTSSDVGLEYVQTTDMSFTTDWLAALQGMDVVVHCAGRVHVMHDAEADPLTAFRAVNVVGALNLASQAVAAGVKRFVFISSIKVNGESTLPGRPFTAGDVPAPLDAYGVSKMEAEQGLRELSAQTGMEVVIIRPPLVYGPGVKANFAVMMRWLKRGMPLPLGAIHNQRSLVALDNLVDLIVTCLTHPAAANQTFLVSDGQDVSTTDLLRSMGRAMGCPARLVPVPASWLQLAATLVGKQDMAQRLCSSLQVDIAKTRDLLGWLPPLSLDQGLKKAAEGFCRETVV